MLRDEQGMSALLLRLSSENLDAQHFLCPDLIGAQEERPCALHVGQDGMSGIADDPRGKSLGYLEPVVIGQAGHGERVLDRRRAPARLSVDALKAEISARGQKAAAGARPFEIERKGGRSLVRGHTG